MLRVLLVLRYRQALGVLVMSAQKPQRIDGVLQARKSRWHASRSHVFWMCINNEISDLIVHALNNNQDAVRRL